MAIKMIKKNFNTKELLQLITANFYSILYYNSKIWLLQSLKSNLKQKLLSASAKAIQVCVKYCTREVSFVDLHNTYQRATPEKFLLYKHAIGIFKLMNDPTFTTEWVALNFNQILTSRQTKFLSRKANNRKVGLNALTNKAYILNNKIPLEWFNMSYATIKEYCKDEFIK